MIKLAYFLWLDFEQTSEREEGLTFPHQPQFFWVSNLLLGYGDIQTTGNVGLGPGKELSFLFNVTHSLESC